MNKIFRYKENQPVVWFHKKPSKSNQYCLYCGAFVGENAATISNKEHLIGREFVPPGSFDDGTKFNFIFRACENCNSEKSDLERHVSSVTFFNSPARAILEKYNSAAVNKASKDYHPDKKGVLVQDAMDKHKMSFVGDANFRMKFELISPPQVNESYIKLLAFRHIQGIFSLLTTQNALEAHRTILLSDTNFFFFGAFNSADWGNAKVMAAIERSKDWQCIANIDTADGFFKAVMKKKEGKDGELFWALEWNKSYRIFGGIFHPGQTPKAFIDLPSRNWLEMGTIGGKKTRIRAEIPINEDQDILFKAQVSSQNGA